LFWPSKPVPIHLHYLCLHSLQLPVWYPTLLCSAVDWLCIGLPFNPFLYRWGLDSLSGIFYLQWPWYTTSLLYSPLSKPNLSAWTRLLTSWSDTQHYCSLSTTNVTILSCFLLVPRLYFLL
jgi:hypothetical protein